MAWLRDRNGRKFQSWLCSSASQPRLGSIFCLIALLAFIFLPLAHQCQLHTLAGLHAPLAAGMEQNPGLQLSALEPDEPHHSHHDAATCPICQAALSCRYFAVSSLSLSPIISLPVQRFDGEAFISIVAHPDILISGPRSPPTSL
jgi:hypothetical protein